MKKQILLAALVSVACGTQRAQAQDRCGMQMVLDKFNQDPIKQQQLRNMYQQQEQEAAAYGQKQQANAFMKTNAQVIIPVVFHIVLNQSQIDAIGGVAGIQQRIDSQITVLNRDYNATNGDKVNIPAAFAPLQASMEITFGIAHTNPTGGSTPGYVIKTLPNTTKYIDEGGSQGSGDFFADAKYDAIGSSAWDPTRYLNIWVVNPMYDGDTNNLLGIAMPPSFIDFGYPAAELGVTVNYRAFGKRRLATDKYIPGIDGGRTLTHELGHFFELRHPWGSTQGECTEDDGIADTPPTSEPSYSSTATNCPSYPKTNTCSPSAPGVMFMNFMDYANDKCLLMFTNNQKTLARSQFDASGDFSYQLTQHPWLINWPQGVEEIDAANSFSIAPNPSNGLFTVSFSRQPKGLRRIAVSNSVGQLVKTLEPQTGNAGIYNLDLSGMSKGVYFVQCLFDGASKTEKIVLQ